MNPNAGSHRSRRKFSPEALPPDWEVRFSEGKGHAAALALEAANRGFEHIVASGGDGTINEILNGLARQDGILEQVALGLLPEGTMNVLARELGIPLDRRAVDVIAQGRTSRVDVGVVDYESPRLAKPVRRFFAQLASIGFDAQVVRVVNSAMKRRWGPLAYVLAGTRLAGKHPPPVRITRGEDVLTASNVLIGNGALYGGPFRVFPDADSSDSKLDFLVMEKSGFISLIRLLISILLNRADPAPGCVRFQSSEIRLSCPKPFPIQVDGEDAGDSPTRISISGMRVRLFVP